MHCSAKQAPDMEHTLDVEPLIITNDKQQFIAQDGSKGPAVCSRPTLLNHSHLSVIDKESLEMIQVLDLHQVMDYTLSATGSAILLRSLILPSTDLDLILTKQDALREIASNDQLRQALEDVVQEYARVESALFKFFNKDLVALFPYLDLRRAKKAAVRITRVMQSIPRVESDYLGALLSGLDAYQNSPIDQMMNGSIYQTFNGLKAGQEVGFFTPKLKFVPHRFSKWLLAGPTVAVTPYLFNKLGSAHTVSPLMMHIGIVWTGAYLFYGLFVKPVRDTGKFIEPFRARCVHDASFSRAIDAVGSIDELLSLHRFAREVPHAAVLPEIEDKRHHFFEATGLTNPVLARDNPAFVPNNVSLHGVRLTFVSGPNSGGKTTICKSIVQNQLLAQTGSYVLAEKAAINIADRIFYQAPKFDGLQDEEGRFGTELSRTRDIFYATSPKSLVILDELAEGTTYEERLHESSGIMSDFYTIGNNTILVTHNHGLVDKFMQEEKGQGLMVEFNGEEPTYRITPGISRVSHAHRIAAKINFSSQHRQHYLRAKGYL
jgi:DNA mismatch repair ATPase MutS